MVAGLEIVNDYGTYQIIDNFPSLGFRQKLSYSRGAAFAQNDLSISGTERSIFVLHTTTTYAVIRWANYNGSSNWTVRLATGGAGTVEVFVFDVYQGQPSGETTGLIVRDSSNRITYSSARRSFEISSETLSKWGFVTNRCTHFRHPAGPILSRFARCSGQTLETSLIQVGTHGGNPTVEVAPSWLTKIDLSGM